MLIDKGGDGIKIDQIIVLMIILGFLTNTSFAKQSFPKKDELGLKNYGFSYCLSKSEDEQVKQEANSALGGYFEFGNYSSEEAYTNVRKYIDIHVKDTLTYQMTNKPAILMKCLDIYNSNSFKLLIKKQSKF